MTESNLAWLDLDQEGRQKMQEKLALLNEPETLDELGAKFWQRFIALRGM